MYKPSHFVKTDPGFIKEFIRQHPFAIMVSGRKRLIATHIPILINEQKSDLELFGHVANHNEQLKELTNAENEVLLIFPGAHGYISSSWYEKADISTWNYSAVHVHAKVVIQSEQELLESLSELVHYFEKDQEKPLFMEHIPPKIMAEHLPHITGFWLKPNKIEAISKMSQNRSEEDRSRILNKLKEDESTISLRKSIIKENENDHS